MCGTVLLSFVDGYHVGEIMKLIFHNEPTLLTLELAIQRCDVG